MKDALIGFSILLAMIAYIGAGIYFCKYVDYSLWAVIPICGAPIALWLWSEYRDRSPAFPFEIGGLAFFAFVFVLAFIKHSL